MDRLPPPAADILTTLRAGTSRTHIQLEQAVDIEGCMADQARYTRLLQNFLGFYRPLERALAALPGWEAHGLDLSARKKTPWLAADLSALGQPAVEIERLPDCPDLPPTHRLDQGFGCLYVLEGATLGGRQITALMRGSPVPADARRFFGSYGPETGARWREFLSALAGRAQATDEAGGAEIVRAAQGTFTCLQAWIVRGSRLHEHPG